MADHYLARTTAWQPATPGQPRAIGWAWWVADRTGPARPMRGPYSEDDARLVIAALRADAQEGASDGRVP